MTRPSNLGRFGSFQLWKVYYRVSLYHPCIKMLSKIALIYTLVIFKCLWSFAIEFEMTTYVQCKHPHLPAYQRFGLDHPFMDHLIEHFLLFHNISLVNVNASVNIKLKRLSAQIIVWEVRVGYKQLIDTEQFRCLKWTLFFRPLGSHKFKNRFYFS